MSTLMLECEIPVGTTPGSKFNIMHEGRYFEVTAPEGAVAGETINIVVNATETPVGDAGAAGGGGGEGGARFDSLQSIAEATIAAAQGVDEKYKLTERALAAKDTVVQTAQDLDAKYQVSSNPYVVSATDKVTSLVTAGVEQAKALDEKYEIVAQVKAVADRIIVYAREVDAKYAISATAARLVVNTVNTAAPYVEKVIERVQGLSIGGAAAVPAAVEDAKAEAK